MNSFTTHIRFVVVCVVLYFSCISLEKLFSQNDFPISLTSSPDVLVNPAFGTFNAKWRGQLYYKNQITNNNGLSIQGAGLSVDWYTEEYRMGAGINVYSNSFGSSAMSDFSMLGTYNYQFMLSDWSRISLGAQMGMKQTGIDVDKLRYGSMYDPAYAGGYNPALLPDYIETYTKTVFDAAVGFGWEHYFNDILFLQTGLSVFHLIPYTSTNTGNDVVVQRKFVGVLNIVYEGYYTYWKPSLLYVRQGDYQYFETGISSHFTREDRFIDIGLYYRTQDVLIPAVGIGMEKFRLGFSMEFYINNRFPNLYNISVSYFPQSRQKVANGFYF